MSVNIFSFPDQKKVMLNAALNKKNESGLAKWCLEVGTLRG